MVYNKTYHEIRVENWCSPLCLWQKLVRISWRCYHTQLVILVLNMSVSVWNTCMTAILQAESVWIMVCSDRMALFHSDAKSGVDTQRLISPNSLLKWHFSEFSNIYSKLIFVSSSYISSQTFILTYLPIFHRTR